MPAKMKTGTRPLAALWTAPASARAAVHVHQHRLCAAAHLGKAMRRRHRHHFCRCRDHLRTGPVLGTRLCDGFDEAGMIAAKVGEEILDARFDQGFQDGCARRVHAGYFNDRWRR
jgi:hypothetical protein